MYQPSTAVYLTQEESSALQETLRDVIEMMDAAGEAHIEDRATLGTPEMLLEVMGDIHEQKTILQRIKEKLS